MLPPLLLGLMFEITIEATFNATHAIIVNGEREPAHGHDWRVRVTIAGPGLDAEGLLCDFHEVETLLAGIIGPWTHTHLNDAPAFEGREPTAELVAQAIANGLTQGLDGRLPAGAGVARVAIPEAPGCVATYLP